MNFLLKEKVHNLLIDIIMSTSMRLGHRFFFILIPEHQLYFNFTKLCLVNNSNFLFDFALFRVLVEALVVLETT